MRPARLITNHSAAFTPAALSAIILALMSLLVWPGAVQAAPALPGEVVITQPDGTTFTARAWGDEHNHGLETGEGYSILQEKESGFWVYAALENGVLVPARLDARQLVVGKAEPAGLETHLRPPAPQADHQAGSPSFESTLAAAPRSPATGNHYLLMILVNFTDRKSIYTPADFQAKAFGPSGSIADYYRKASFNRLNILPARETSGAWNDGVVMVDLNFAHPNPSPYSDADFSSASQNIAREGFLAIKDMVDMASFDTDGDGFITSGELHFIFIVAGFEQAYSPVPTPGIWAHRSGLETYVRLNGKYVGIDNLMNGKAGGYAMFGELHGETLTSYHIAQIGIMVHELGHDLEWPDLYDTDYSTNGVGNWSVMGGGSWNRVGFHGDSPALPDAFLKWYQGWLTPINPLNVSTYALAPAASSPSALLIGNDQSSVAWSFYRNSGTSEYWLVEYRQKIGYDAGLPGSGILIWHINEKAPSSNAANANESLPLVALEQADGYNHLLSKSNRGDAGDPFPGSTNKTNWGPATNPGSLFYSGASSGRSLNISAAVFSPSICGGIISGASVKYFGPEIRPAQPNKLFLPMLNQGCP